MPKTLIIGLGNRFVSDDGVGPRAVDALQAHLDQWPHVELRELCLGGLRLMEEMIGYDRVWIIDSMKTGRHPVGTLAEIDWKQPRSTQNISCLHDTDFGCAVQTALSLGLEIPGEIRVWAVEARDVETFSENLTPAVAAAVPRIVETLLEGLDEIPEPSSPLLNSP